VLVVLQAIDGGGKDSTIRHVFSAFNPQGCAVTAFKVPSPEELRHDYLWRVHTHVPARGEIAVFNRSHYEEVLIARVDSLVPRSVWQARYRQINNFERMLVENDIPVLKMLLHISKSDQRRRFY
jgi:polyphosphate kinase 2 (PPK2 family)